MQFRALALDYDGTIDDAGPDSERSAPQAKPPPARFLQALRARGLFGDLPLAAELAVMERNFRAGDPTDIREAIARYASESVGRPPM
jgi:hypothetical protein